jgi:hypothetical protein
VALTSGALWVLSPPHKGSAEACAHRIEAPWGSIWSSGLATVPGEGGVLLVGNVNDGDVVVVGLDQLD